MVENVHIRDINEKLLFDHLLDDETNCLVFDSPSGCIDRHDVKRYHWQICEGWPEN